MQTTIQVPSEKKNSARPAAQKFEFAADPQVGQWLWACRAGFETDLCTEFERLRVAARMLQPGLVISQKRPTGELVFARQGFLVQALCRGTAAELVHALHQALAKSLRRAAALQVFVADSDAAKPLTAQAAALQAALSAALTQDGQRLLADGPAAHAERGLLAQVCLLSASTAVCGVLDATAAPSLHAGGVQRVKRPRGAPSRSAHKLVEALAWLEHSPEAGEICVDLGAAPGGWSQVLCDRRCQVIAVDPGALAPAVARRVHHQRKNAFVYAPEEPADWLFCDMAYRPLEVAGLLARWGRRSWARFLLANIKLPMKQRVDMLGRVREILTTGGWTGLRVRQLYHDREEVTLFAWRGFGIDTRTPAVKARDAAREVARDVQKTLKPAKKTARNKKPAPAGRSGRQSAQKPGRSGQKSPPARSRPR